MAGREEPAPAGEPDAPPLPPERGPAPPPGPEKVPPRDPLRPHTAGDDPWTGPDPRLRIDFF